MTSDGPYSWWCSKCGRTGGAIDPAGAQAAHDQGECRYLVHVIPPGPYVLGLLAEIDRLKAAHRETVNLIAWLDPSRTRTAQYRQMAQDAGIPEDAS